ncbi:MAG: lysophospholipid acyltransferase family protein, partial [Bdellovibrionales bacterium]|nr:lysophospholipid acyltransferase family protein [Bdellovibrionales bacterium]
VRRALGWLLGVLWFDVFRIRRQVALENISIAFPRLSQAEKVQMARSSLVNLGTSLVEYLIMITLKPNQIEDYFEVEGLEQFEAANRLGKGVLLMSMHLGNGDFGCAYLSRLGLKINLISKQFKAKWLNDFWFGLRREFGTQFIPQEKSSFDILKALKRKESVIFVMDQYMGAPVGVRTTFFGKETGTAAGLALFHLKTEAPLLPVYTYRKSDGKQVISFGPVIELEKFPDREHNIVYMTQKYNDIMEQVVRNYPGQWMWIHRRWKEYRDS